MTLNLGERMEHKSKTKVSFIGGARYNQPLDATSGKKFRHLAQLGEIFVIGFAQGMRPRLFKEHARFYLFPIWPLPVLRYLTMLLIGPWLALWLIWRHGVHILVAQSPYEGWAAAWAKRIACWLGYRVFLIVESHGNFEASLFLQRRIILSGMYRFIMRRAARFSLRHADALRAISRSTKAQLEQWAPGKLILHFPTWTDIEVFLQAGARKVNGEKGCEQHILYAGVLIPCKGVHHLLRAFTSIKDAFPQARLTIIGYEKNKRYAASLKAQVKQGGLDGRVHFVDEVPQVELAKWMQRVDVLVLPSISEGLGRVILEAMATALPVIGSEVGGIPDLVVDGVTGYLIPPGDEVALAARLRWLLEHPEVAREMGRRARAFAEHCFSNDVYIQGYRQIFEVAHTVLTAKDEHAPITL